MRTLHLRRLVRANDQAPIAAVRIAQGDVRSLPRLRVEPPAGAVHVAPARLGELRRVGDGPNGRPHLVMARPGRARPHQADLVPGEAVAVDAVDRAPDFALRDPIADVVLVDELGGQEGRRPRLAAAGVFLADPERLARRLDPRRRRVRVVFDLRQPGAEVMVSDGLHRGIQLRVFPQVVENFPVVVIVVRRLQLHAGIAAGVERRPQRVDDPLRVGPHFILPRRQPVDFQTVLMPRHVEEGDEPIGRILREAAGEPAGIAPRQAVEEHLRVSLAGLGHQPELVAPGLGMRQFLAGHRVRRLAAVGRVLSAADLHLQVLQGGAELGLEKEVEHFVALLRGIVDEVAGGGAGADAPNAFERPPRVAGVEHDGSLGEDDARGQQHGRGEDGENAA